MNVNINIISSFFNGKSDINAKVYEVVLEEKDRIRVCLLTYGASICRLMIPNRNGLLENVVLGFEHYPDYYKNPLFAGATLAPSAGRISGAVLPLGDHICRLSANDGRHNLHGGFENASHQNWTINSYSESPEACSVTFNLRLPHSLDGFPGSRSLAVCYTLKQNQTLEIKYMAATDTPTYFNMSNHSYFNLSGDFTRSGLEQTLMINAGAYIANNTEHIPEAINPCSNSPFHFQIPATLQSNLDCCPEDGPLCNANGYNNAFLLKSIQLEGIKKALTLTDNVSGRQLDLYTDQPAVVLYSGGFIGDNHVLTGGARSSGSCAIALEAQDIPDVCHIAPDRYHLTKPGNPYQRFILFSFGLN